MAAPEVNEEEFLEFIADTPDLNGIPAESHVFYRQADAFKAVREGDMASLRTLLTTHGVSADASWTFHCNYDRYGAGGSEEQGIGLLGYAAYKRQPAMVRMLVRAGAHARQRSNGLTPLSHAAVGGCSECMVEIMRGGGTPRYDVPDCEDPYSLEKAYRADVADVAVLARHGPTLRTLAAGTAQQATDKMWAALVAKGAAATLRELLGQPGFLPTAVRVGTSLLTSMTHPPRPAWNLPAMGLPLFRSIGVLHLAHGCSETRQAAEELGLVQGAADPLGLSIGRGGDALDTWIGTWDIPADTVYRGAAWRQGNAPAQLVNDMGGNNGSSLATLAQHLPSLDGTTATTLLANAVCDAEVATWTESAVLALTLARLHTTEAVVQAAAATVPASRFGMMQALKGAFWGVRRAVILHRSSSRA